MARTLFAVILTATISMVLVGTTGSADVAAGTVEHPGSHSGSRSLGVGVSSDGEALENVPVTIVNKKTKSQVFSGYTDSAGQINVTLPQGQYDVVVQGQKSKTVNLNKDQSLIFELDSDERPNE